MNKTNFIIIGLTALCAALLAVTLVNQSKQKQQVEALHQQHDAFAAATAQQQQEVREDVRKLSDQLAFLGTNLESRLSQNEQQAKGKADEVLNIVQQNTAVMHRALGNVIPVVLPESLTNKLFAFEARIADEKLWPKDSTDTDAWAAELKDDMRQIPAWAEDDLLPQLNRLRWAVQSLQVLQVNADATNEDLETAAEAYEKQLSIQPDGGSTNLATLLETRQNDAAHRFETFRQDSAINDAKEQLGLAVMTDGLAAWQRLSEWTNSQQAVELRQQLGSRLLEDEITNFIASANSEFLRATNEPTATLRQISLGRLLDGVLSKRQTLIENPNASENLRRSLTELALQAEKAIEVEGKMQTVEQDNKMLEYQRWALEQIQKFNDDMGTAEKADKGMIYDSPDYARIKNDMVAFLAPVSAGLLDPAVSRLYNEAFERGWKKLENRKDLQTEVAKQEAVVKKHKP